MITAAAHGASRGYFSSMLTFAATSPARVSACFLLALSLFLGLASGGCRGDNEVPAPDAGGQGGRPATTPDLGTTGGSGGADGSGGAGGSGGAPLSAVDAEGADAPADATPDTGEDADPAVACQNVMLRHGFEDGTHGWADLRHAHYKTRPTRLAASTAQAAGGRRSLEIALDTAGDEMPTLGVDGVVETGLADLQPGMCVRFRLFFPSKAALTGVQAFLVAFTDAGTDARWFSSGPPIETLDSLAAGSWATLEMLVPREVTPGRVVELGLELRTAGAQKASVYVDDVAF